MPRFQTLLRGGPLAVLGIILGAHTWKWLKRLALIALLLWWGSSNFLYVDLRGGCTMTIAPSFLNFNSRTIVEAMHVLKTEAPIDYANTCFYVRHISTNLPPAGCAVIGGGCYWQENPGTIYLQIAKNQHALMASVIAHETCHAIQDAEQRELNEEECYGAGDRVIRQITDLPHD